MRPMRAPRQLIERWGAAVLLMLAIFVLSSRTPAELPDFGWADRVLKKGGHMLGYGLLALSYWHGMRRQAHHKPLAWALAVLYGATDELHQAFVPGRHPSAVDLLLFDSTGAALALWLGRRLPAGKTPTRAPK